MALRPRIKSSASFLPCPKTIQHGFISICIPNDIKLRCQQHVLNYFKQLEPNLDIKDASTLENQLTTITANFSDSTFVKTFIKGMRTFPLHVTQPLIAWLESDVKSLLGANEIALTNVSELDQENNQSLSSKDYDVYWRCVRPNKNDIARPHTDSQFANLNEGSERAIPLPFEIKERWRIWFPLFGCHEENSIQLIKDSYQEDIPFTSISTANGPRPDISEAWVVANEHRFQCPIQSTNGVLFRDDVVHRGPKNKGPYVRISAEFTVVIR